MNISKLSSKKRTEKTLPQNLTSPHNLDVLSLLFGSLLGDTHGQVRSSSTNSVRFTFRQSNRNVEYLMWFHKYLADRGYCNSKKPIMKKTIGRGNKIHFYYRINTYSYRNLFWFYNLFYKNKIKHIPENEYLRQFLTPLALAIWFMDDGFRQSAGVGFGTHCFQKKDLERLVLILKEKYDLNISMHRKIKEDQFTLYIPKKDMIQFSAIVKRYMVESMHYKLNGY